MANLTLVKTFDNDSVVVRCNDCFTYYVMSTEDYLAQRDTPIGCCMCSRFSRARTKLGEHQPYGMLRPLARVVDTKGGVSFLCLCDCGTYIFRKESVVTCGYSRSCGCKRGKFYDFVWEGEKNYLITDEDLEYMDALVFMLDDSLETNHKLSVVPEGKFDMRKKVKVMSPVRGVLSGGTTRMDMTLESMRERFHSPAEEQDENTPTEPTNKGIEDELPWAPPAEDIEDELPWTPATSTDKVDESEVTIVKDEILGSNLGVKIGVSIVGKLLKVEVGSPVQCELHATCYDDAEYADLYAIGCFLGEAEQSMLAVVAKNIATKEGIAKVVRSVSLGGNPVNAVCVSMTSEIDGSLALVIYKPISGKSTPSEVCTVVNDVLQEVGLCLY